MISFPITSPFPINPIITPLALFKTYYNNNPPTHYNPTTMIETLNFLIIGRSGSGKSATTRLLTGHPSISSKISPNSVTKSITFYSSTL